MMMVHMGGGMVSGATTAHDRSFLQIIKDRPRRLRCLLIFLIDERTACGAFGDCASAQPHRRAAGETSP